MRRNVPFEVVCVASAFAALLGLDDFRKDAFATGCHAYLLQRKYPHAEIAFSMPAAATYHKQ